MLKTNRTKLIISLILIFTLVLNIFPNQVQAKENNWWDESFPYRKEINIPFDTSISQAKFQPIDVNVNFENNCYAKNEKEHSIRVIYQKEGFFKELECQIYDLEKTDEKHIKSCNLVFLIPEVADGNEKYYLYYNNLPINAPEYTDHISVKSSYYSYEPISGFAFVSRFYEIIDEGEIIYTISQDGEGYGTPTAQKVGKLNPNSKEATPQNGEVFASFDFYYYPVTAVEAIDYISTSEKLVSKEITIDGNLMVEVGIISKTNNGKVQTTGKYKYYHSPTDDKRVHVNIKHETNDEIKLHKTADMNGVFARIRTGEVKSSSIKDLNFGRIYPYFHFYDENNNFCEYPLNGNQEGTFKIINTKDDIDLGEKSWVSFDEGKTGKSHGLIIEKTEVLKSGEDEKDGIQMNSFQSTYPNLPGLDTKSIGVQLIRNYYEENGVRDDLIPNNYLIEYNAEFFSSIDGGYTVFEKESDIFKKLVEIKPKNSKELSETSISKDDNSLTIYVHNDKSLSLGSIFSALTGKKLPYVSVELYKNNSFISSGLANNLPIRSTGEIQKNTGLKKIGSFLSILDWRNFSLFKKVRFSNLEKGTYLLKIFRENSIIGSEKKYIGFKILDLDGDAETKIICRPESSSFLSIVDQNKNPIKDVTCNLKYDDFVVSSNSSDDKGNAELKAPFLLNKPYVLNVLYKGRVVFEKEIDLKLRNILSPIKEEIVIENYDLNLKITDTWGEKPCFNFNTKLRYSNDNNDYNLKTDLGSNNNEYQFDSLIPGSYILSLNYQDFNFEKEIDIKASDENLDFVFPVEYTINFKAYDSRGSDLKDFKVEISRGNRKVSINSIDSTKINIPPGNYYIKIISDEKIISNREIQVLNDNTIDIVTSKEPSYPAYFTILSIALIALFGILYIRKKNYLSFSKILLIGLSIIALVSPWWVINGTSDSFKTSYKMFLNPASIIGYTEGNSVSAGELSQLPELFILALQMVSFLILIGCILLVLNLIFEKYKKLNLNKYTLLSAVFCYISAVIIFIYAAYQFASVSVGGFIGSGNLNFDVPGRSAETMFSSSWGPGIGFYLVIIGIISIILFLIYKFKKETKKSIKDILKNNSSQKINLKH